jgi:hypothetical protein
MRRLEPRRARAGIWTAILLAGVIAPAVEADEEAGAPPSGSIVTDRPTDSASPELVPRKTLQFELGYKFSRLDTDSGRVDTQELPDLLARFGVSEKVEARLTATDWTIRNTDTGNQDGLTDVSLGAKIALADERGRHPQMSLLADVSVPVGDPGFTNDYVIPKVLFLAANHLTDRLGLTYNLGPSFVTRRKDNETQTDVTLNYAVALGGAVGKPVTVFGEAYGAIVYGEGLTDRHAVQAGATMLLNRIVQFDVRGGLGLVNNVPRRLAGFGFAFRLPP